MNRLLVNENKLIYEGKTFELNDLFTEELYQYSNDNVHNLIIDICVINEVFLKWVQPLWALILFIKKEKIELTLKNQKLNYTRY